MVAWDLVISGGITATAATAGYVVGTLKPIIGRDYHTDRKWCERLRKLYKDAINLIKKYNPISEKSNFEEIRAEISILYDDIKDHLNGYPNYRRRERNQAKNISQDLDEISKTWPEEGLELRSSKRKDPPIYIRKNTSGRDTEYMTPKQFVDYKEELVNKIQKADEFLSYGKIYFVKSLVVRDRTI